MKNLKLIVLLYTLVNLNLSFGQISGGDAAFMAFVGGMAMPESKSPCIAMGANKVPLFKARKAACAKGASFFVNDNSCFFRNASNSRDKQNMKVNQQYCSAMYFDLMENLKNVNRRKLNKLKRKRALRFK